jgi:hypothetical protein
MEKVVTPTLTDFMVEIVITLGATLLLTLHPKEDLVEVEVVTELFAVAVAVAILEVVLDRVEQVL